MTPQIRDWTANRANRSNSSPEFEDCVRMVDEILRSHRLGDATETTARLIMAHLAHRKGLAPKNAAHV